MLAGVSVSWYTWLEQGRPINASVDVLDALARALRLDPVERAHLLELAGHPERPPIERGRATCPRGVLELVARLQRASEEFRDWWPRYDVAGFETHRRVFDHARAGRLVFETEQLVPVASPDVRVIVHLPVPADDSAVRLAAVTIDRRNAVEAGARIRDGGRAST